MSKKTAGWSAFFVAALTSPLGAFIAYPVVSKLTGSMLGLTLGFMVGVLIYISSSHLLPEAQEQKKSILIGRLSEVSPWLCL